MFLASHDRACTSGNKVMFHIIVLALIITGTLMALSAEDLGPAGPVVISLGISIVFFSLVVETLYGISFLVRLLYLRLAKKNKKVD